MNKYDVTTERDGWHRVTRNGRIIRAYLPFPARRSEISTRPDGYNLFMFRKDAAVAARKMNALAGRGFDKMGPHPHR